MALAEQILVVVPFPVCPVCEPLATGTRGERGLLGQQRCSLALAALGALLLCSDGYDLDGILNAIIARGCACQKSQPCPTSTATKSTDSPP